MRFCYLVNRETPLRFCYLGSGDEGTGGLEKGDALAFLLFRKGGRPCRKGGRPCVFAICGKRGTPLRFCYLGERKRGRRKGQVDITFIKKGDEGGLVDITCTKNEHLFESGRDRQIFLSFHPKLKENCKYLS